MVSNAPDKSVKKRPKPTKTATNWIENSEASHGLLAGEESEATKTQSHESAQRAKSYLRGELWNVLVLLFLYMMQGIPLGLSSAIPIILQKRSVTYSDQAEFSIVSWPFSLKLLWAPIVDAFYNERFGRRKSWLVPTQYFLGIFMLIISANVDEWLGEDNAAVTTPSIKYLTAMFFACNFFAATQDIAVDGWALTMLRRENVGLASTCNSVGQTAGFFLGYVLFIALDSPEFCNSFRSIPKDTGVVTIAGFTYFWGWAFVISTTLIAIFKSDKTFHSIGGRKDVKLNVAQSYSLLWKVFTLKPVRALCAVLLTAKMAFVACDVVSPLKLIEKGVPKDKMALLAVPLIPLQIVLPLIISKYVTGQKPMTLFVKVIPYRLGINLIVAILVATTPSLIHADKGVVHVPLYYYGVLLLVYGLHQITLYSMFVASMAFFAKISDPRYGGTYMTLLNTLSNLGGTWPATMALWMVDVLTTKECYVGKKCTDQECTMLEKCEVAFDGFYTETIVCTFIGIFWYVWSRKRIYGLQRLHDSAWFVRDHLDNSFDELR